VSLAINLGLPSAGSELHDLSPYACLRRLAPYATGFAFQGILDERVPNRVLQELRWQAATQKLYERPPGTGIPGRTRKRIQGNR